jgi:ribosomal protein L11 methyltransferase
LDLIEISVTTDGEAAEAVVELFNRHCRGGSVVEIPVDCYEHELEAAPPPVVLVKAYLPLDGTAEELQRRLEEGLWHLGQIYPIPEPVVRRLAETEWADAWKRHYHLQRIGRRIVIVPTWEEYVPAPDEVTIRLEPGMAFGTGLHPTTRLCLQAMEKHLEPGSDVLDVGTGSGVLAIAAAKLGARSVLALEADLAAVSVAQENVAMNGVAGKVSVQHGTLPGGHAVPLYFVADHALELLDHGQFDAILINILAPVIISMAPDLASRLTSTGKVIASGLIESQDAGVTGALGAVGLEVVQRMVENDWVALVARRS